MIAFENNIYKCEIVKDKINVINHIYYILNRSGGLVQYDDNDKYAEKTLSIFDKRFQITRRYLFKKELFYIDDISISESNDNYIIIHFERTYHVFFLSDLMIFSFPGNEIHYYGDYILFLNEVAYIDCTSVSVINVKTRKREILNWFTELLAKMEGYVDLSFMIRNDILEYTGMNQKYFYDLNKLEQTQVSYQKPQNLKLDTDNYLGYFIDYHSVSSVLNHDGSFTTIRTNIGELLYKYKYNYDISVENELSDLISSFIIKYFPYCEVIIPIPPSNLKRPFQPLIELAQKVSEKTRIPCNLNYLFKKETPPLKSIEDNIERRKILKDAFSIRDNRYITKSVLLLDDLFRSGETINAAVKVLKEQGQISEVYVLAITKTRTNR